VTSVPRVALVHDWLTGMRGGEKVLEVLCDLYRDADLFTLVHVPGSVSPLIERRRLRTSLIQRLPLADRHYRHYLPLFPFAVEWFDLDAFDLVISTSHCAAKAVVKPGRARHLCYCHTPMRYAWDQFDAYFGPARAGRLGSRALRPVLAALARWDAATAHRVDRFVANSRHVADRIRRYYNRSASVVYPPVDTTFFHPDGAVWSFRPWCPTSAWMWPSRPAGSLACLSRLSETVPIVTAWRRSRAAAPSSWAGARPRISAPCTAARDSS
jgi:hypothetical protein